MLIAQLEKAESAVKDLFLEATDDGIEALDAVLAACCEEVLRRGPRIHEGSGPGGGHGGGRGGRGRHPRGGSGAARSDEVQPRVTPLPFSEPIGSEPEDRGASPYNEAAS